MVIWNSATDSMQGTFGQRFDASGLRRGSEFLVRDSAVGSGGTQAPSVAVAPTGEYLVVWQEYVGGPGSSNVIGQRFDASGDPMGAPFRINDATNSSARLPPWTSMGPVTSSSFGMRTSFPDASCWAGASLRTARCWVPSSRSTRIPAATPRRPP